MISAKVQKGFDFPIRVGIVGTGYVARRRAEAFQADPRARLVAIAGRDLQRTQNFAREFDAEASASWQELAARPDIDLLVASSINRDRPAIVRAALENDKHAIAEYPLALDPQEAEKLVALARDRDRLLHIEHIELLGGLHQAMRQHLPAIAPPAYARYVTISPKHLAPQSWTYNKELFGFPLIAALARLRRFTDLFGNVASASCQQRYWDAEEPGYYHSCLVATQLKFSSGLVAEVTYGKGEIFWQGTRCFEVRGERGTLLFDGSEGLLIDSSGQTPIEVGSRRGLFVRDTQAVLDALFDGKPLYSDPMASCYALRVADAARRAAEMGQTVVLA